MMTLATQDHHIVGSEMLIFSPWDDMMILNEGMAAVAAAIACFTAQSSFYIWRN